MSRLQMARSLPTRVLLCLLSGALVLAIFVMAGGLIGMGLFLSLRGADFTIGADRVSIWPESLPAIKLYAWAAPGYFAAGAFLVLVLLPLLLALLEKVYLPPAKREGGSC